MLIGFPGRETWPLVGRGTETDRLASLMRRPGVRGVLIAGPAGVGKSRLAAECLLMGEERGHAVVRVVATRAVSTIPLGTLAPLLPTEVMSGGGGPDGLRRAIDALAERAASGRLVVVVDDAHLMDDLSAAALQGLASTHDVFMVLTVRSGEPAADAVLAMWRDGAVERIDLSPLDRAACDELIDSVLEGVVDGGVLYQLHERSLGNPLYLRELLLGNVEEGRLCHEGGIWRAAAPLQVSDGLRDLLWERIAGRPPHEREALEILAVGEPLTLAHFEQLVAEPTIESLEQAGLLVVDGYGARRVVNFAHPIYGEVVRASMPAVRVARTARGLAEGLSAAGQLSPEDLLRAAVWRMEGGAEVAPEQMLLAARHAFAARDLDLAERLARAALETGDSAAVVVLLAEVLADLGRFAEAEELLRDLDLPAGEGALAVQAAMVTAQRLFREGGQREEADAVLASAADLDGEASRARTASQRAVIDLLAGEPARALDRVGPHLEAGMPWVLAHVTMAAAPALALMGRCEEALDLAIRGKSAHDHVIATQGLLAEDGEGPIGLHLAAQTLALAEGGLLGEAEVTGGMGYNAAIAEHVIVDQAWFALLLGRTLLLQGRVGSANRFFREGAAIFGELRQVGLARWCVGGQLLATATANDRAGAEALLTQLDETADTPVLLMEPDVDRARAWLAIVGGDMGSAREWLFTAAERARSMGTLALEAGALHDLARVGEAAAAKQRLEDLAGISDSALIAARAAHAGALVAGDPADIEEASRRLEFCGALLLAAEAAAQAAAQLRRDGQRRAAERSSHRSLALARRCGSVSTPALALGGAAGLLTARQREVAALAGAGVTNREIADRLSVSLRTVENHLHQVFEKLGVSRREALAEALSDEAPV